MADVRRWGSLGVALLAAAAMLAEPSAARRTPAPPVTARAAWPHAQRAALPATLADGAGYEPAVFLDASRSVGTALTTDGHAVRLVLRAGDGSVRVLRELPVRQGASFDAPTVAGQTLVWVETTRSDEQMWALDLSPGGVPRRVTGDLGDARFYQSQYDLVVAGGRVHWVAAGTGDTTEVRSVRLAGGQVDVRTQPGTWSLAAWPWLADGVTAAGGTTRLRNLSTGRDRVVARHGRGVIACSPLWCRVVSFNPDGDPQLELMRPGGADRRKIGTGTVSNVLTDTAVLDRFEVFSRLTGNSDLTGHFQLLVYEIATRTSIEISPDATDVSYRNGVLWWSTGNQDDFIRHTLDLRTV
ncbi:hypothetical protein [Mangrovihabitans endophyticus]|uniref:Uncharacterized protein n=1 Tax=Mangrovihabitans endophyticus TaxID=1751298 RepID=A0A8J3FL69_9ACTN|nr:hypothetical protein [Mangrovihabitans endophyticus]GGK74891.1 hypothetical protein GCM10012284_06090 [Mangrovihabitans endophyticus]